MPPSSGILFSLKRSFCNTLLFHFPVKVDFPQKTFPKHGPALHGSRIASSLVLHQAYSDNQRTIQTGISFLFPTLVWMN